MRRRTASLSALIIAFPVVLSAQGQEFARVLRNGEQATLSVFGPRPVDFAAKKLVDEFRVVINVEDPPYFYGDDVQFSHVAASGKPVTVPRASLLEMRFDLAIGAWTATVIATSAQTVAVADDVVIKLERTSCFGECPVYTVTIDARGSVIYDGAKAVRVVGRQTDRIPLSRVAAILEAAERIGFFELSNQYRSIQHADGTLRDVEVDDIPDAFVTITHQGRSKRVRDHIGAPDGLKQLERQIDEAARTKRWILLDEQTLDQLVRDGWRPTPEERADLLRRAVERDEVGVVKGLIDVGADPNATYFGTNTPPLMVVQSAATARVLLNAGAYPTARNDNGGTPLGWSIYLTPDVAELLLKSGARVDEPSDHEGGTPLWYAAGRGNVGVVSVLLGAGADPAVRRLGQSVLECAKNARDAYRLRDTPALYRQPYVEDFDGVIRLVEQALAKRSRR